MHFSPSDHTAFSIFPASSQGEPIIELQDICFAYEEQVVLRHITYSICSGDFVLLQGGNGCGKTTLLRIINGLSFPQQGQYHFMGQKITEKSLKNPKFSKAFHQKIGYLFQNVDAQLFCASVSEEIAFGPVQMGLGTDEIDRRTQDLLSLFGIEHLAGRAPYHLSGGEKKKVALAAILATNPDMLILDEPFAGLDHASSLWLDSFLQSLHQSGKTILLTSHMQPGEAQLPQLKQFLFPE